MASIGSNFVEGIGVAKFEDLPISPSYFTQISIPEVVCLPEQKPDIEQLISVMADIEIVSTRIIVTPGGDVQGGIISNEGQKLTGRKLSVEILIKQKIKYVADEPTQSVHAAHFDKKMASIFIVIPKEFDWGTAKYTAEELLEKGKLIVTPYIEDIYGEQRDKRCIFKNITLLLTVKPIKP
jgi:hypothetical protein